MVMMIAVGRAPSPALPRFAGEGAGSAGHPAPAERGAAALPLRRRLVAERSEAGWGRDRPAKAMSLKA